MQLYRYTQMSLSKTSANERYRDIDLAKGLGILFITLGHIKYTPPLISKILYSFHVPLFFVIAGYLFSQKTLKNTFKAFLIKKAKALLKPYLVLAVGIFLKSVFVGIIQSDYTSVFNCFKSLLLQQRYTPLWFLSALFISNLFFYLICKLSKRKLIIFLISLLLSAAFITYGVLIKKPLPWNIDAAFVALIFMAAGYCLKDFTFYLKRNKFLTALFGAFCLTVMLVMIYINYRLGAENFELFLSKYGIPPITFSAAILGSTGVILLCSLFKSNTLEAIGKNSLVYFGWQNCFAIPLALKIVDRIKLYLSFPLTDLIFTLALALIICYLLDKLLELTGVKKWMTAK